MSQKGAFCSPAEMRQPIRYRLARVAAKAAGSRPSATRFPPTLSSLHQPLCRRRKPESEGKYGGHGGCSGTGAALPANPRQTQVARSPWQIPWQHQRQGNGYGHGQPRGFATAASHRSYVQSRLGRRAAVGSMAAARSSRPAVSSNVPTAMGRRRRCTAARSLLVLQIMFPG